jgi:hypothetical protein
MWRATNALEVPRARRAIRDEWCRSRLTATHWLWDLPTKTITAVYTLIHHETEPDQTLPFLEVGHQFIRLHFGHAPKYHVNTKMTVTGSLSGNDMAVQQVCVLDRGEFGEVHVHRHPGGP